MIILNIEQKKIDPNYVIFDINLIIVGWPSYEFKIHLVKTKVVLTILNLKWNQAELKKDASVSEKKVTAWTLRWNGKLTWQYCFLSYFDILSLPRYVYDCSFIIATDMITVSQIVVQPWTCSHKDNMRNSNLNLKKR